MPVMQIRIMRMLVPHGQMFVGVGMRPGHRSFIGVLVMFVVNMRVIVLKKLMLMLVFVSLGQMEPEADAHKSAGHHQPERDLFAQQGDRQDRTDEGGE